jgi:hypothetical protein
MKLLVGRLFIQLHCVPRTYRRNMAVEAEVYSVLDCVSNDVHINTNKNDSVWRTRQCKVVSVLLTVVHHLRYCRR